MHTKSEEHITPYLDLDFACDPGSEYVIDTVFVKNSFVMVLSDISHPGRAFGDCDRARTLLYVSMQLRGLSLWPLAKLDQSIWGGK